MNHFSFTLQPSRTLSYAPMDHPDPHPHPQNPYPFFHQPHPHIYDDFDPDRSETSSSTTTTAEKDPMFEKPLTPSDVGKLNRLVIPKQHAEKYFPLAAATTTADAGGGLLLGFEDETGKCWRFRYSYWNSSQSYVLTKGWSRFVKDKKLDAGDVVFFDRHRFDSDRFFIGCRRRGSNPLVQPAYNYNHNHNHNNHRHYNTNQGAYNTTNTTNNNQNNNVVQSQHINSVFPSYIPNSVHADDSKRKAKKSGGGKSRRLRLFGVNLECELEEEVIDDETQTSDSSSISSHGQGIVSGLGSSLSTGPTSYNYFDYMGYPHT